MPIHPPSSRFDVAVIGGGSAGFAAARTAAAAGVKVAVVEGAREVGGLCILRGCMPTKALLESARRWKEIREAGKFGLRVKPIRPDLRAILARKDALIADFASHRRKQLETGPFAFIRGHARFLGPRRVEVSGGGKKRIVEAKAFILATGSEIQPVPVPGLRETGFLTSDTALVHAILPPSIVILGGGSIAVEFAQFYAGLGSRVTVIQRSGRLVKEYDPEVSAELEKAFRRQGIKVFTGTRIERAGPRGKLKEIVFTQGGRKKRVAAAEILYALGRRPRLGGLALAAAGIPEKDGRIEVDAALRTKAPHIFAAGDVAGPYEIVHIAVHQGEIAARNAVASLKKGGGTRLERIDYRLKAGVVFTEPEIASAGLTETEAREKGIETLSASYPFNDHGKSMILGAEDGFVKLTADRKGRLLGAQIIGPHASDLIHEMIAVLRYRGTAAELAAMPHYHPTLAEIVTYPAEEIAEKVTAARRG